MNIKKFIAITIGFYLVVSSLGMAKLFSEAQAGTSTPLTIKNAKGQSLTVGSVSIINDGDNLTIELATYEQYPLFFTTLLFRNNSGGIIRDMSSERAEHLTHKSSNKHVYTISLSQIKGSDVTIFAEADVIVNGDVTSTWKAFFTAKIKIPQKETTTTKQETTTTKQDTTTTTKGGGDTTTTTKKIVESSTTTAGGGGTTSTTVSGEVVSTSTTSEAVAGGGTTLTTVTTVRKVTPTTTQEQVSARQVLPFTGTGYNWYLIGAILTLTGAGIFIGSGARSVK